MGNFLPWKANNFINKGTKEAFNRSSARYKREIDSFCEFLDDSDVKKVKLLCHGKVFQGIDDATGHIYVHPYTTFSPEEIKIIEELEQKVLDEIKDLKAQ